MLDYCRTAQGFSDREQFRVLFLDKRNLLIADEVQQTGTVDHTPVYPREVVKRALEAIIAVAGPLGIAVHDHLIVGKDGHASLKGLGLICVFSRALTPWHRLRRPLPQRDMR